MAELIAVAPAKINLHLEVLGLRPDGFHELAMVMQSLELADRLELASRDDGRIVLHCEGAELSSGPDNLIVRAAESLRRQLGRPQLGATLLLQKRIPIGAGLAGGSSDAAATLLGLAALWQLELPQAMLQELAAGLGSDVPFCLAGGCQLCFGRGELLEPLPPPPAPWAVLLVKNPQASVSTPWAYGRCRELRQDFYLSSEAEFEQRRAALRQGPLLAALRSERPLPPLRNDLQAVVEPQEASVRAGLELLRRAPGGPGAGPLAVAMSGSGPSLFALFPSLAAAEAAERALAGELAAAGLESWCCRLRSQGVSLEAVQPVA
ncbi:MAG: 4-(cytidine 5'-diphospho)-2-C-methyl-D-erythritol kinase [Prochlorococcaceae cyanobacterium]